MFELFLYACVLSGSGDYTCSVIKAEPLYDSIVEQIDKRQAGASKQIYDRLYRDIPYDDLKRKDCETKGNIIVTAANAFNLNLHEADYVCIKVDHIDSELKAHIHFAGNNG